MSEGRLRLPLVLTKHDMCEYDLCTHVRVTVSQITKVVPLTKTTCTVYTVKNRLGYTVGRSAAVVELRMLMAAFTQEEDPI